MFEGLALRTSEAGRPLWELRAQEARILEDSHRASLVRPHMDFYKDRRRVSWMTAETGEVQTEIQDVRLSGSVVVVSTKDRSTLRTETLEYSSKRGKLHTQALVNLERPDARVKGVGMEASPDLSEVRIFKQESHVQK